jgi:hypothetical protein
MTASCNAQDPNCQKELRGEQKTMMQPQAVSEQLLFSTVRLTTEQGSGTGFFFHFKINDQNQIPVIVTNKHVVNNKAQEQVEFSLHVKDANSLTDENINIKLNAQWIFHPTYDLCCTFVNPLLVQIREQKKKEIFYIPFTEELIWDDSKLEELQGVEDILMVGYPIGLFDRKNNLPLLRKGVTASHPAIDFNGESIAVVDCSCFPGSSGSPILLYNDNGYTDKKGTTHLGAKRIVFLGVLFSGPTFDAQGNIVIKEIPTQQKIVTSTPMMVNLGYYIKAKEIFKIKEEVLKVVKKNN